MIVDCLIDSVRKEIEIYDTGWMQLRPFASTSLDFVRMNLLGSIMMGFFFFFFASLPFSSSTSVKLYQVSYVKPSECR